MDNIYCMICSSPVREEVFTPENSVICKKCADKKYGKFGAGKGEPTIIAHFECPWRPRLRGKSKILIHCGEITQIMCPHFYLPLKMCEIKRQKCLLSTKGETDA